jgi:hypothetical protein
MDPQRGSRFFSDREKDLILAQPKRGYAGIAVFEGFNRTLRFSVESHNVQFNPAISGKPKLKKTVA